MTMAMAQPGLANVSVIKLSNDPYTNTSSYHKTEVEPDTFSFGNTIVGAFQVGRFFDGAASNVGWARSADGGATWSKGFLPATTPYSNPPGPWSRVTDPSVSYDPKHNVWIIVTLALTGTRGAGVLASRSTNGGQSFNNPVTIASTNSQFFDKTWVVCDTWAASQFYGNCYVEFDDNFSGNLMKMYRSADGGLTWQQSSTPGSSIIGGQPLVQPDGTVVMPTDSGAEGSVESFVSTNGGSSYSGPFSVSGITDHGVAGGLRTGPLISAEIDGAGKIYVVWQDCRFRSGCSSNDIVMSTSTNGTSGTSVVRIPTDATNSGRDHFIPGLGVDKATSGGTARLGLTYYFYPSASCSTSTCQLSVGFISSPDGGASWTQATQVTGPMSLLGLPNTNQGYMVGDYISTSWTAKAYPVVAKSRGSSCTLGNITSCKQKMVTALGGLATAGPLSPVGHDRVVSSHSDHPKGALPTAF